METFLIVVTAVLYIALILIAAMRPLHERDDYQADLISIQQIIIAVLFILSTSMIVLALGWGWGLLIEFFMVLFYGSIGRLRWVSGLAERTYQIIDKPLLKFIARHPKLFRVIRAVPRTTAQYHLGSIEELEALIKDEGDILTLNQKRVIINSLRFDEKTVDQVMTPRSQIVSIDGSEFLGPLVLDEIHNSGHSRLPVIGENIDHVNGVLYVSDLLSLDNKKSATAEELMENKVFYIREDDSLQHALAAFIKTHHHLFIVINDQRETVGLVTLEDVLESLLGQEIIDEDDNHQDPRLVASRTNNRPTHRKDV